MSKRAELLIVLLVGGCSSGGSPPAAPVEAGAVDAAAADARVDAPIDVLPPDLSFCDPYAAKICERLAACIPGYVDIIYGGLPTCQERFRLGCRIEGNLPGTGRRKASSDACVTALSAASCVDVISGNMAACQVTGLLAVGAACGSSAQCSSGFCRTPETSFCGKCAGRAAEGAECDSDEACVPSLLCSDAGRCAKPGGAGAFCNETRPCQVGVFYCSPADNTCQPYATEGKSCNRAGPTPFQPCNWGLACRPAAGGTCQPIKYVSAGAACGVPTSMNALPVLCLASGSCISGTCKPPGADDAPCTLSPLGDSPGCMAPALCLGGVCKLPDPAVCK